MSFPTTRVGLLLYCRLFPKWNASHMFPVYEAVKIKSRNFYISDIVSLNWKIRPKIITCRTTMFPTISAHCSYQRPSIRVLIHTDIDSHCLSLSSDCFGCDLLGNFDGRILFAQRFGVVWKHRLYPVRGSSRTPQFFLLAESIISRHRFF